MVAIEHRQKSTSSVTDPNATNANSSASAILSPTSPAASTTSSASAASTTTSSIQHPHQKSPVALSNINNINNNNNHSGEMSATQELKPAVAEAATAAADTAASSDAAVADAATNSKSSAVSQRHVDVKITKSKANKDVVSQELTKKVLKLDLAGGKELDEFSIKSPKSPITARLPHQTSLTSSVDVEDRKTLREALYQGIFHRHRRTIFAVGSFLRMLRSRNSQYNTIRSSSEGEDVDEAR